MNTARVLIPLLLAAVTVAATSTAAEPPDQAIRKATERLQQNIRDNHARYTSDTAKFYRMVDDEVVPLFDQHYIAQLVLGRHWRQATEEQRTRFITAFKNSLVYSYADALLEYHDSVKLEWRAANIAAGADKAKVHASLMRASGPPIALAFSVRQRDGRWLIYDVNVENISLAANFRAQFNSEVRKSGLEALITRLEKGDEPLKETRGG